MDKERILREIKKDMEHIIQGLTYENAMNTNTVLGEYANLIKAIGSANILSQVFEEDKVCNKGEIESGVRKAAETNGSVANEAKENANEKSELTVLLEVKDEAESLVYEFERKVRGGVLDDKIFIPEHVVRDLGLQHRDLVRATLAVAGYYGDKDKYYFELEESKGAKPNPDIVEFNNGVLDYREDISSYVVEKDINGKNLKIDEVPTVMRINDFDVSTIGAKEGDIVDIAWYKNNVESVKIRWVISTPDEYAGENTTNAANTKKKAQKESKDSHPVAKTLKGKKVLLVGMECSEASMREEVEKRGGEFMCTDGNEGEVSLFKKIKKNDVVVVAINHCSHRASIDTHNVIKHTDIPIITVDNYGRTTFIRAVHEGLGIATDI